ncbi:MAG: lysophospholipid acyltransferase family protein [Acidocella sp.]|nr:lysophospholipid acyltransferase family protein [Acidocella sp.]
MRFIRAAVFNCLMGGSGLVLSLYGLLLRRVAPEYLSVAARVWGRFCLWALRVTCNVRVRVEGVSALPPGPVVIAAQHQSAMDILIWLTILPSPAFVLKRELCKIPLFGALLVPAGNIAVDRDGGAAALRGMVVASRLALAAGRQVVIFPEGTRVAPGARGALHGGIVALARIAGVPVIPAATDTGLRWGARRFLKTPGVANVRLYPPLAPGQARDDILGVLTRCFYETDYEK